MGLLPLLDASDVLILHCPLCCFHTHWLSQLETHFNFDHGSQTVDFMLYQCSKCHKIASSKAFLTEHIELHHSPSQKQGTFSPPHLENVSPIVLENGHGDELSEGSTSNNSVNEKQSSPSVSSPEAIGLPRIRRKIGKKKHSPYVKTLFVGQLCGQGGGVDGAGTGVISTTHSQNRLGNGPVLGIQHQCLFCDYATAHPKLLSRHYARHGIRHLQLPGELDHSSPDSNDSHPIVPNVPSCTVPAATSATPTANLSAIDSSVQKARIAMVCTRSSQLSQLRSNPLAAMDELTKASYKSIFVEFVANGLIIINTNMLPLAVLLASQFDSQLNLTGQHPTPIRITEVCVIN
ncbi:Zinc finger C2H2 type [Paragonimus westermani]|uniref:Zinc finger C2H2 type n=1 Tax=Paragonimus westermani TaxID=34504 RepID=A0A8T0DIC5_9TREM|nr:Zinc finger C2H2 type [Paragonimus westermani]